MFTRSIVSQAFKVVCAALPLAVLCALPARQAAADTTVIDILAHIDGHDQLLVSGNAVQWHHLDGAAVGRVGGNNEPTYIRVLHNDQITMETNWIPDWPEPPPSEIRYEAYSSPYIAPNPFLPNGTTLVSLSPLESRWGTSIAQQPAPANNNTLIVDFNDDTPVGSDWYHVKIVLPSDPVLLDFEALTGMTYWSGNPIPDSAKLSTQYLSTYGVQFSSSAPYVAVVALGLGHATSGVNGIGGATADGLLTYFDTSPITITFFDPSDPTRKAVTDFVSVRGDMYGDFLDSPHPTLTAYDVNGNVIAWNSQLDVGGETFGIQAPGIHSVTFSGVPTGDGGVGVDDLIFDTVVPVTAPSDISVSPRSGVVGSPVTLFARLWSGRTVLAGKSLSFEVNGSTVGTGTTDSNGFANVSVNDLSPFGSGQKTVTVKYFGDGTHTGNTGNGMLVVHYNTLLTLGSVNGVIGRTVSLRALLRRFPDAADVAGKTVTFTVDGLTAGTATTDSNGLATLNYTVSTNLATGSHTFGAAFAGDGDYNASTRAGTFNAYYTTLVTVGAAGGRTSQTVPLRGLLRRYPDGAVVAGKTLTFKIDGAKVGTAVTGANGLATLNYVLPAGLAAGSHTLTISFAGDGAYAADGGTGTLVVKP